MPCSLEVNYAKSKSGDSAAVLSRNRDGTWALPGAVRGPRSDLRAAMESAQLSIENEADRLRSALLNSIAHDLTAPIASVAAA